MHLYWKRDSGTGFFLFNCENFKNKFFTEHISINTSEKGLPETAHRVTSPQTQDINWTYIRHPGRLLNVLCTFKLCPVSTRVSFWMLLTTFPCYYMFTNISRIIFKFEKQFVLCSIVLRDSNNRWSIFSPLFHWISKLAQFWRKCEEFQCSSSIHFNLIFFQETRLQ